MRPLLPILLLTLPSLPSHADVIALTPVADCFLSSANPTSNYGGGGALCIASPSSPNGEFQSLLRFDTTSAIAAFDTSFGPGNWSLQSATLRLNAASPVAFLFNPQSAGTLAASWLADDSWLEGSGTPASPGITGITFNTLPALLNPTDEPLGSFSFDGSTTAAATYGLALTPNFRADLAAGTLITIRLHTPPLPAPQTIAYVFNSRTHSTTTSPLLTLTAIAAPPPCPADFNQTGGLTVQDIFDFLTAWFAANPAADFNHADSLTVQDIFDFLSAWFLGC